MSVAQSHSTQSLNTPWWLLFLALLLFLARFGYAYASSDQDEILPFLLHLEDAELFANDWFVGTQTAHHSVRTYFVWLLFSLSRLLPLPIATAVGFLFLWIVIARQCYALAFTFTRSQLASALTVILALVVTHKWSLGGNDVVYAMLVPEMAAWALGLWALNLFTRDQYAPSALALGMATWFQLLVGLQLGFVLGILLLWDPEPRRRLSWLVFGVLFLLAALPVLIPIASQQLTGSAASSEEIFYILSRFRNPHHHLPFSFSPISWLTFCLILIAGVAAILLSGNMQETSTRSFISRFLIVSFVLLGLALIFTEIYPVLLIAKLQLFKLTVVLKLMLLAMASWLIVDRLPDRLVSAYGTFTSAKCRTWTLVLVAALTLGGTTWIGGPFSLLPDRTHNPDLDTVSIWARDNTSPSALFSVPPSASSFRSVAHRSIVINYNAFPFRDDDMVVWFERLSDFCPVGRPDRGIGILPDLVQAYHRHSRAEWVTLADEYQIDYIVTDSEYGGERPAGIEVFRSGPWSVYLCTRIHD